MHNRAEGRANAQYLRREASDLGGRMLAKRAFASLASLLQPFSQPFGLLDVPVSVDLPLSELFREFLTLADVGIDRLFVQRFFELLANLVGRLGGFLEFLPELFHAGSHVRRGADSSSGISIETQGGNFTTLAF